MADGWSIDPSDVNISSDGTVTFPANTGSDKHYTVYYRQGEHCGKYTFTQEGSGGGGGGDCDTYWTTSDFRNVSTILSQALSCTGDGDMTDYTPAVCTDSDDYKTSFETLTIKIVNKLSGYYIPFSGKVCIGDNYVFARRPTSCDGGLYWYYGGNSNKGFDSNFLIRPGYTATFKNCIRVQNKTESSKTYFAFNVLETVDNSKTPPFGNRYFHSDNPSLNDLSTWGMTSAVTRDSQNLRVITFTISPDHLGTDNWWYGNTRHYALSESDVRAGYVYFDYTSKAKIVPTHLGKIVNGSWNGYPGDSYYPYDITPNT